MNHIPPLELILMTLVIGSVGVASSSEFPKIEIDIPFTKYVLDNGLTLIVHEDHKAPIVAVNVWYHVGSKNEKPGKTGFAHLFEHLMFNGSKHFNDDYFKLMEPLGATNLNGTTNFDRTNYFQNVPKSALDVVLWAESDRMGHLLDAIDQAKLDEQRGVVINEKRQGENQPYGKVFKLILKSIFPAGHPYSWPVIGSEEDLNAASLEDVQEWFQQYYGPSNAVICVAGDIEPEDVKARVEKYFGDIPAGPPIERHEEWIAKRTGTMRQVAQDRVPMPMLMKVWNVPPWGSAEGDYLELVASILSSGKTSRLYKRLVYEDQIAVDVRAFPLALEIAGGFGIQVMAKPGMDLAKIEKAVNEEMETFLRFGPSEEELIRVKNEYVSNFVRGIEQIGGFGGKSDILASNQVYAGDPAYYKVTLERIQNATRKDLLETAQTWLTDGEYVLEVHPFADFKTKETGIDRTKIPAAGDTPAAQFPAFSRTKLSNGLDLVVVENHSVPLVNFRLLVDAGYAADSFSLPGMASMAMEMLDEGTQTRDTLKISEELITLGAELNTWANLDECVVRLSTLKTTLDQSLEIFLDVLFNPTFPEKELDRVKKEQIAAIQMEKKTPDSMALRVLPKLLYGEGHAYSNPLTGSGTEESVQKMTREDIVQFYETWFKPNNAALIVIGDITIDEMVPKIEKLFAGWKPGDVPQKNLEAVQRPDSPQVYLIDRPGSDQSVIYAGHVAVPKANPDEIANETVINILGGKFTSRLNMNLREDKHWTYGARTRLLDAEGPRPFFAQAPVQSDKTKDAILEIQKELADIADNRPPSAAELKESQAQRTLNLAGRWETMNAVENSLEEILRFGLPDDYYRTYAGRILSLTVEDTARAAKNLIHPHHLTWVVVGDRAKIESSLKELGFGEVRLIDVDGNPVP
ncbi:MAG: insulinase family protein [Candidatus Omnitrophica bacterium]|nr:insulinase family protein [Candidatus Omnitrophota bacterium]HPP01905.1 pitrilysin family protein [bacterium]